MKSYGTKMRLDILLNQLYGLKIQLEKTVVVVVVVVVVSSSK